MPRKHDCLAAALPIVAAIAIAAPAQAEETHEVQVVLSLTGTGAFSGQGEKKTLELIEQSVNRHDGIGGRKLHFVIHDDGTNPQLAVQIVDGLVEAHENVILGPTLVAECNAAAPLVKNGPVMYCLSPSSHPPAGSYVFSAGVSSTGLFGATIRYFRDRGWTRLGLLTSTDASGQDADNGFAEVLGWPENRGVAIVEHAHFNLGDVSVAAQIESMRAAHPDVLLAWTTGTAIATIFKAAIAAGYEVPMATSAGNQSNAQMAQFANFLPRELYIPSSGYPPHDGLFTLDPRVEAAQHDLYEALRAANVVPDQNTTAAWDPALIVIDALRHLGTDATAAEIRTYLAGLDSFAGINGLYNFKSMPQRGIGIDNAVVTRWKPEENRWLWVSEPGGKPLGQ